MGTLLQPVSAFAADCEQFATRDSPEHGVSGLVEPFGYQGLAGSGRLGHSGTPENIHFANWAPGWLEFYRAIGARRSGTPLSALVWQADRRDNSEP